MVLSILLTRLESLLNDIEELANGCYDIVSIFSELPKHGITHRQTVSVVIRIHLIDEEIPFDEEEIKKKLGF